ncbi:MAG TPA: hypothetical protein DGH68_00250, partial [Bacteroidetes bacterium]|nr:hypothetical protein [Bacteroidota bacterium]
MRSKEHIHIVGESSLVLEYGILCLSKKQQVTIRANPGETVRPPKGTKKATAPPKSTTAALELTNISADIKKKNLVQLDRILAASVPIISSSTTVTVAEQSTWIKNPRRL